MQPVHLGGDSGLMETATWKGKATDGAGALSGPGEHAELPELVSQGQGSGFASRSPPLLG